MDLEGVEASEKQHRKERGKAQRDARKAEEKAALHAYMRTTFTRHRDPSQLERKGM